MDSQSALRELEKALKELNSTSVGRRAFLSSIPFLMAACASAPKTRYREGDNTGQATEITVTDERKMTAQALTEMKKDYPPLQDAEVQAYIRQVGARLVQANGLEGRPYTYNFTVVDVGYVNAFALPAGTVFVTTPLIAMADSEAELAGVIGHEIGHVQARHAAERMDRMQKEQKTNTLWTIGGGILGGAAGFGIGKLVCPPRDQKCLQTAALAGVAAGAGGTLLIQKYRFMANSREDEMEADRIGFKTALRAGYSKAHVGAFYAKLLKMEEERKKGGNQLLDSFADALSTHPPSRERVAQMSQMASQAQQNTRAVTSTKSFEHAKQKAAQLAKKKA